MNPSQLIRALMLYHNNPASRETYKSRLEANVSNPSDDSELAASKFMLELITLDIIKTPVEKEYHANAY